MSRSYNSIVENRPSRGDFSFTGRRGGTNKPRTMREAVIGGDTAKMWEPSGLFLPGGGRAHPWQRREPGRKKRSPRRGFQAMQNRRQVVALVKASAISGSAFFKAAVSILLLVTGFQVTL